MLGGYIWFGQGPKVRKNRAELAGNGEKTSETELGIFDLPKPSLSGLGAEQIEYDLRKRYRLMFKSLFAL